MVVLKIGCGGVLDKKNVVKKRLYIPLPTPPPLEISVLPGPLPASTHETMGNLGLEYCFFCEFFNFTVWGFICK